jgi:hypothetical protein
VNRPSPWWRRTPWTPVSLTVLLALSTLAAIAPIRDAADGGPIGDARLERSLAYSVLGPWSSMLDAMTLFSVGQIIGFTLWAFGVYIVVRLLRRRTRPVSLVRELVYAVAALVLLLAVYGAAVLLPRPMARLVVTRTDVISVDFHAHTRFSHDGRPGWTAADVRDWHAESGYDVAYITDHRSMEGVREALALDSAIVGEGTTTLLPGLEAFYKGEHVNILNVGVRYRGMMTADYKEVDDEALTLLSMVGGNEPILIETIPGDLSQMVPATAERAAGVRAIEIVAGSPRGMSQIHRERARIVRVADSLDLALVAGSDNHGWGRTAPGWTLLRIPGVWRTYSPDSLATMIDQIIRVAGRDATIVVERTTAGGSPAALAMTMPVVLWTVMRTLSPTERLAWLFWIWIPVALLAAARRRRAATPT